MISALLLSKERGREMPGRRAKRDAKMPLRSARFSHARELERCFFLLFSSRYRDLSALRLDLCPFEIKEKFAISLRCEIEGLKRF
jgi:hypothetical protein